MAPDKRDKKPAEANPATVLAIKIWLIGTVVVTMFSAIVQQIRYPDSAAWIVALLGGWFSAPDIRRKMFSRP